MPPPALHLQTVQNDHHGSAAIDHPTCLLYLRVGLTPCNHMTAASVTFSVPLAPALPPQAMRDRSLLQAVAAEFIGVMLFQLLAGSVNDQPLQAAFTFAAISECCCWV